MEIIRQALANGWTVKEAAFHAKRSIKAIHHIQGRAGVSLCYGGRGRPPTPEILKRTQDFLANLTTQPTNTQPTTTR